MAIKDSVAGLHFNDIAIFEDSKELRIGNIINHVGYDFYEDEIFPDGTYDETVVDVEVIMFLEGKMDWYTKSGFSAIQITQELLFKLGFVMFNTGLRFPLSGVFEECDFLHTTDCKVFCFGYYGSLKINYLHQLQNLYFALTGKELIL